MIKYDFYLDLLFGVVSKWVFTALCQHKAKLKILPDYAEFIIFLPLLLRFNRSSKFTATLFLLPSLEFLSSLGSRSLSTKSWWHGYIIKLSKALKSHISSSFWMLKNLHKQCFSSYHFILKTDEKYRIKCMKKQGILKLNIFTRSDKKRGP